MTERGIRADVKITGARVVDGTGAEPFEADVAVRDGRIVAMGDLDSVDARDTLDAEGKVVCPGFIDIHTHCLHTPCDNYLAQGVTTVVGGNCGFSPLEPDKTAERLARRPIGPHLALLVGHNSARRIVLGRSGRAPDEAELERMRAVVRTAMEQGAFGVSSGLQYPPGSYSIVDEVAEVARAASPYGGFYASHIRDEGAGLEAAVEEALEVGAHAGLAVHVSHLKAAGRAHWGKVRTVLERLRKARADGMDVTQDAYPYAAGCGPIGLLVPHWAEEGEPETVVERLADPEAERRFLDEVEAKLAEYYGGDLSRVRISECHDEPALTGQSLADIAQASGRAPDSASDGAQTVLELFRRHPRHGAIFCVLHMMSEDDVEEVLRDPHTMVASDGWSPTPKGHPHPRLSGTFPRALGLYARERNLWKLPEAVRKMTGLPAQRLGLTDRGVLAEGVWADLVVFDPETFRDRATFEAPLESPVGIEAVLLEGRFALRDGQLTGQRPGRVLRRNDN